MDDDEYGNEYGNEYGLDREEVLALTRRAELMGIPPSALARNLIRIGATAHGQ